GICGKRAGEISVYANRDLFRWHPFWSNYKFAGTDHAVQSCWYSQLTYWIYEDVVDTVVAMNAGSSTVYSSAVKRLLDVSFGASSVAAPSYGGYAATTITIMEDRPAYIIEYDIPDVFGVVPWTGRVGGEVIDVVHFKVEVIVNATEVMPFMKQLCSSREHKYRAGYSETGQEKTARHNQITILRSQVAPIERTASEHDKYRYGDGAVVRLNLICEYIFQREGYDQIKPDSIKLELGQLELTGEEGGSDDEYYDEYDDY
ncbi:MAG: hypothetical protein KAJ19_28545, partial [Gammaproteobacteria bacterium]|nr:hypothetical protein [Gammaproteobacteria bacterium]